MILLYNVVACIISNMYSCPSSFSESYLVLCSPSVLFIWIVLHWVHTAITLGMTCILQYDPDFFYYFCCCWFFFFSFTMNKRYKEITIIRMQNYKEKITRKPNKNHRACKLCRFPPKKYKMTKTVHYYSKWCIDNPYLYEQFNLCSASTCICIHEVVGGYRNAWSHPTVYTQVLFVWFTCIWQVSHH